MGKQKDKEGSQNNHLAQQIEKKSLTLSAQYSGPLPPPSLLKAYDEIVPGLADRIVKMAENESAHRHSMEQKSLDAQISDMKKEYRERGRGQIFALIIALVTVIGGCVTAIMGAPITGGFIGTGGLAGLVTAFIYGRKIRQNKE